MVGTLCTPCVNPAKSDPPLKTFDIYQIRQESNSMQEYCYSYLVLHSQCDPLIRNHSVISAKIQVHSCLIKS